MQTSRDQAKLCPEEKNDTGLLNEDDAVRALVLDSVLGFESSKCCYDHKRFPAVAKNHVRSLLKARVFLGNKYEIDDMILKILQMYFRGKQKRLALILQNYLQLFDINSGVTIMPCHNYKMDENVGVMLVATRNLKTGDILNLHNFSTELSILPETIKLYSVTETRGNVQKIWIGPCSTANHSCNSNACYYTAEKGKVLIEVKSPISVGEEITVNYQKSYFGDDCECVTCKRSYRHCSILPFEERSKRNRAPVDYNSDTAGLTSQEKLQACSMFNKLFKNVDYPDSLRAKALEAEQIFCGDINIIQSNVIQTANTSIQATFGPLYQQIEHGSILVPELENFESNALKTIVESQILLGHSVNSLISKDGQKNYLEPLKIIEETIRNLQDAASKIRLGAVAAMSKTAQINEFVSLKSENRKRNMERMGIRDGDSNLLPEVAMLRKYRRKSKTDKHDSYSLAVDLNTPSDSPPSLAHSTRSSVEKVQKEYLSQDERRTSCPKIFKHIFNDILDGDHDNTKESAVPSPVSNTNRKRGSMFVNEASKRKKSTFVESIPLGKYKIQIDKVSGDGEKNWNNPMNVIVNELGKGFTAVLSDDTNLEIEMLNKLVHVADSLSQEFSRKWHERSTFDSG